MDRICSVSLSLLVFTSPSVILWESVNILLNTDLNEDIQTASIVTIVISSIIMAVHIILLACLDLGHTNLTRWETWVCFMLIPTFFNMMLCITIIRYQYNMYIPQIVGVVVATIITYLTSAVIWRLSHRRINYQPLS